METQNYPKQFADLVSQTAGARADVRKLVNEGRWREAEKVPERAAGYAARRLAKIAPPGAEAIVGDKVDLQGASFLTEGSQVRRAVCYVEVSDPRASKLGSGFLISPRLLITNFHVIGDIDAARGTQITFDKENDEFGIARPTTSFRLDPDLFALFSPEEELDYAVVAVGPRSSGGNDLSVFGYCVLSDAPDKHVIGMNVNIIQHPSGWPKMIAIRDNLLTHRTDRTLLYETDTMPAASGSPAFNDDWDLVALHHWAGPFLERKDDQGKDIPTNVNEGVRISAIYDHLESRLSSLNEPQRGLLSEALSYSKQPAAISQAKTLSPPRPSVTAPESMNLVNSKRIVTMESSSDTNGFRVTVPLEISVRLGSSAEHGAVAAAEASTEPAKVIRRGAEAIKINKDYSDRTGYDPAFIPGVKLPLPTAKSSLAKQIVPLRAGEPDAESGELKYEHFSIKMNKGKRMAMFTAANIDGATYLEVDRKTGQVTTGAEAESWSGDQRISASYYLDQTFYAAWSNYFDRGHLTRRTDPTWGTTDEAEQANADTFHFTNCTPQHFRFNETTKYWQGAERYVLENGLLTADSKLRMSVFQGPVFDDAIDCWSDDVQIPSSFFKIVVWMSGSGLKAVGMVVDQLQLMSETRRSLGQPHAVESVNVSQWRVPIKQIEQRTGLDFGDAIRKADTISSGAQPLVGAEAGILLRSLADLLK